MQSKMTIHSFKEPSYEKEGNALIQAGKVGCLILGGGQATRLGFSKPKGLFPVSVVKKKPLFQLFKERRSFAGKNLPLAVMTSSATDDETRIFFKDDEVDIIKQNDLPFLDVEGRPLALSAPKGNGEALQLFYHTLYPSWKKRGVEFLNVILVDNALADPFDRELIGCHSHIEATILAKAVKRRSPDEKVGIFMEKEGKVFVKEYSEISEEEKKDLERYPFANISSFSVKMEGLEKLAKVSLPLHLAKKPLSGEKDAPIAFKQELFIFDLFPFTHTELFHVPRALSFAPLKNREGEDSLATVQKALLERDRDCFFHISGTDPGTRVFELSQGFYYPDEHLLKRWRGKALPNTAYIEVY